MTHLFEEVWDMKKVSLEVNGKKITKEVPISPVIEKRISDYLSKRKKEFSPSPD